MRKDRHMGAGPYEPARASSLKGKPIKLSLFPSLGRLARLVDKERGVDVIDLDFTEPSGKVLPEGRIGNMV